jgi:dihydroorotase
LSYTRKLRRSIADDACVVNFDLCILPPPMKSLLLNGGRVIDPANQFDAVADLLILEGKVAALAPDAAKQAPAGIERMDVKGLVVCPGLIDLHVHLREPG